MEVVFWLVVGWLTVIFVLWVIGVWRFASNTVEKDGEKTVVKNEEVSEEPKTAKEPATFLDKIAFLRGISRLYLEGFINWGDLQYYRQNYDPERDKPEDVLSYLSDCLEKRKRGIYK